MSAAAVCGCDVPAKGTRCVALLGVPGWVLGVGASDLPSALLRLSCPIKSSLEPGLDGSWALGESAYAGAPRMSIECSNRPWLFQMVYECPSASLCGILDVARYARSAAAAVCLWTMSGVVCLMFLLWN